MKMKLCFVGELQLITSCRSCNYWFEVQLYCTLFKIEKILVGKCGHKSSEQ